jgi:hypothetical protein
VFCPRLSDDVFMASHLYAWFVFGMLYIVAALKQ